jgi:hypothetical protein
MASKKQKPTRKDYMWQKAMYLVGRPDFKKDMHSVRKLYGVPLSGFRSEQAFNVWAKQSGYYGVIDENDDIEAKIDLSIAEIIAKPEYELSAGWQHAIKRFMFFNNVDDMQLPIRLDVETVKDPLTDRLTLHVIVTDETSQEDYIESWENVKYLREYYGLKAPKRRKEANTYLLKRKKLAYETWLNTDDYNMVVKIVNLVFVKELKDTAYTYNDAKTDVNNYKRQSGI